MALISLRQLLECGAHFGHPTRKWNPKMAPYIFTKRNGIHILDLQQTTKMVDEVHDFVVELVAAGGKVLFVGTKKQAQEAIEEEAKKCGMPYVNQRWLGGMLTNFKTISKRIERLVDLREKKEEGYFDALGKKEAKSLTDEMNRLHKFLRGLVDMKSLPQAVFVIDVQKEENAVLEARKCGIPVIGILDSNCSPDLVNYMIVGNDDAIRSIRLFCQIIADSVLEGKQGFLPPDSVLIQATVEEGEEVSEFTGEARGSYAVRSNEGTVSQKKEESPEKTEKSIADEPAAKEDPVKVEASEADEPGKVEEKKSSEGMEG